MAEDSIPQKQCTRCKTVKPLTEFYLIKAKQRPRPACKLCDSKLATAYYETHREHLIAYTRQYNAQHREESRAASRKWRLENPERMKALMSEGYLRNREREIAKAKERAAANPGRTRANQLAYRASEAGRIRHAEAEARRRAHKRNSPHIEKIDRAAIIARDKSICYLCLSVLTSKQVALDHVIPLSRGGHHTADNLRVCCKPCNSKKRARLLDELQSR